MRIELDNRPAGTGYSQSSNHFAAIRLYPDTNQEMAALQWILDCKLQPEEYILNVSPDCLEYAVCFSEKEKKG